MTILSFLGVVSAKAAPSPGLQVKDGILQKDGQPYRGLGVNYFNAFHRAVCRPTNTTYREGFAVLQEHQIPFARFAACGFWPSEWGLYQTNRALYFKLLDDVVQCASTNQIGLIPSLFWRWESLAELVGEPHSKWGDPASKTHDLMRRYTTEVVTRYRGSPTIWAWEFANEMSLAVDLPNATNLIATQKAMPRLGVPKHDLADIVTSRTLTTALTEFARTVRQHDPHRAIISGNSLPRPGAWHNTASRTWATDTRAQFCEVLVRDNPDPLSLLCVHVYPSKEKRFSKESPASQLDVLRAMMETSRTARKPLFIGEFGASKELGTEGERAAFLELLEDMELAGVPLAAVWVFDLTSQNADWNITASSERAYMLRQVGEAHRRWQRLSRVPETR